MNNDWKPGELKGLRNVYFCEKCIEHAITENTFDLVTPFMIGCKRDSEPPCDGVMQSRMYPKAFQKGAHLETIPTTHYWIPYTDEEVAKFKSDGNEEMYHWATNFHGKLITAKEYDALRARDRSADGDEESAGTSDGD